MYKKAMAAAAALVMCLSGTGCNIEETASPELTEAEITESVTSAETEMTTEAAAEITAETTAVLSEENAQTDIMLNAYDSVLSIDKGGVYKLNGVLEGTVNITCEDEVTLILNGVDIRAKDGPAIYAENTGKLIIELPYGTGNSLTDSSERTEEKKNGCIYSKSDLRIKGEGLLNISGTYEHGIVSKDSFKAGDEVKLNITAVKDCIHANDKLEINGGTYTLKAGDDCIQSETEVYINGGTIACTSASKGIAAESYAEINDGEITITASGEGIESKGEMVINGGTIKVTAVNDGINASSITVNNGDINVTSSGNDAVDSNGTLIINGGKIFAIGAGSPECAIDSDNRGFTLNGGEVIGIGGAYSVPNDGNQKYINVSLESTDPISDIDVRDEDGNSKYKLVLPAYELKSGFGGKGEKEFGVRPDAEEGFFGRGDKTEERKEDFGEAPDGNMPEMPDMPEMEHTEGDRPFPPEMRGDKPIGEMGEGQDNGIEGKRHGGFGGMENGNQNILISLPELTEGKYSVYSAGREIGSFEI